MCSVIVKQICHVQKTFCFMAKNVSCFKLNFFCFRFYSKDKLFFSKHRDLGFRGDFGDLDDLSLLGRFVEYFLSVSWCICNWVCNLGLTLRKILVGLFSFVKLMAGYLTHFLTFELKLK